MSSPSRPLTTVPTRPCSLSRPPAPARPRRTGPSWLIWGVGAGVYVLAVFHRTSLGVAGPDAQLRFGLTAAQLGTFVMLQLGMYAAMQVPTGIMVDRFGPRRMLLAATTVMGCAQLLFAVVDTYPLALLARGSARRRGRHDLHLGAAAGGRLVPGPAYPVITSLTGLLGAMGNLIATLPLTASAARVGWTATFAVAGTLSLAYAGLLLRKATDAPFREMEEIAVGRSGAGTSGPRRGAGRPGGCPPDGSASGCT